jgi:hypothetical protein
MKRKTAMKRLGKLVMKMMRKGEKEDQIYKQAG